MAATNHQERDEGNKSDHKSDDDLGTTNYNFNLPIDASQLANDRLRLVPFDANYAHFSDLYYTQLCLAAPENFAYLKYGPFDSVEAFRQWYEANMVPKPGLLWFAIIVAAVVPESASREIHDDDHEQGTFAGTIAYLDADPVNASVEIGHINILPQFQRSFVGSNANGLLLKYALDAPPHGLGLRRVQWHANTNNKRSVATAERLGFRFEGILRWHQVIPSSKEGNGVSEDDLPEVMGRKVGLGRHTASLSICWDDWRDGGVREKVEALMNR